MTAIARITLLSLVLGLSACAVQRPSPDTGPAPPIPAPCIMPMPDVTGCPEASRTASPAPAAAATS